LPGEIVFKKILNAIFPSEATNGEEVGDFRGERENDVYRRRFGAADGETIATPSPELLKLLLPDADARFRHVGVLCYSPFGDGEEHTFVTSGLSDPWEFGAGHGRSGLGFELVFTTTQSNQWPKSVLLRLMLHQLGVANGSRNGHGLEVGDRIPLRPLGVAVEPDTITGMIVARAEQTDPISTGTFDLLRLVGVTTEEYAWSLKAGTGALTELLTERKLVTLPRVRETIAEARGTMLPDAMKSHF
jgi:hypothetical protein